MAADDTSAIKFPCIFPIKAVGLADADFELFVVALIRRHAPRLGEGAVSTRASGGGKYLAVTVTITANDQAQLDAIYRELSGSPRVIMAL